MAAPTTEEVLHLKALDTVGSLLANYEAGKIGAEAFRTGVETVWACLGGVVICDEFRDLMASANAEIAALPSQPHITILEGRSQMVVLSRVDEIVRMYAAKAGVVQQKTFDLAEEAIEFERNIVSSAPQRGLSKVA